MLAPKSNMQNRLPSSAPNALMMAGQRTPGNVPIRCRDNAKSDPVGPALTMPSTSPAARAAMAARMEEGTSPRKEPRNGSSALAARGA